MGVVGAEFSLAGAITGRLTIVAGATYVDPEVTSAVGSATTRSTAVGPVPVLLRVNAQYRVPWLEGLRLDARIETLSKRYVDRANTIRLPSGAVLDAGIRYMTTVFGKDVTARLQGLNLTDARGLRPQGGGLILPFADRTFEFSLAIDM